MTPSTRRQRIALPLALATLVPTLALASPWSGIVDPARAIDWSGAGVVGGIPTRTTICSTLNPGASAAQINSAIASCPSGQVVYLSAGTYNLSAGIDFGGNSNVTVRGAGANKTIVNVNGQASCFGLGAAVCMRNSNYLEPTAPANSTNWTAGYAKGSASLTLASTAGISVGTMLVLNQANDTSDTGNVYVCSSPPNCASEGPGGAALAGQREQLEFVTVTAVSGNQVTISPALSMPNWRSSQSPRAWWVSGAPASGLGIEDMTLNQASASGRGGIVIMYVTNSWIKGVKSTFAPRNHVWIWEGSHITVRDSHFYESVSHASQSYGVEIMMGSHNLIENNIFRRVTAPLMVTGPATGSVYAYNYTTDDTYSPSPAWMQPSSYFHAAGGGYVLHEGNQGAGLIADDVHGPTFFVTAFRNQWDGWEAGKSAQTVPVNIYALSRYFNIIGNVLGHSGYHNTYTSSPSSAGSCETSIYALGLGGNCGNGGGGFPQNDVLTFNSTMRWGNYDVANAASRFVAAEVPSGIGAYKNAVPGSQSLPPSFYLAGKPSWWGSMPFPVAGPDVSGGDIAGLGGHAWRNPAHVCYDASPKDSNGQITTFDPLACYGGGGDGGQPLAPPKNVKVS
jgi:hypothetical protein